MENDIAPKVNIERDESLRAFEVNIIRNDKKTDAAKVLVYDDGHIEAKIWTQEELTKSLTGAIIEAVKDVYDRGVFK